MTTRPLTCLRWLSVRKSWRADEEQRVGGGGEEEQHSLAEKKTGREEGEARSEHQQAGTYKWASDRSKRRGLERAQNFKGNCEMLSADLKILKQHVSGDFHVKYMVWGFPFIWLFIKYGVAEERCASHVVVHVQGLILVHNLTCKWMTMHTED